MRTDKHLMPAASASVYLSTSVHTGKVCVQRRRSIRVLALFDAVCALIFAAVAVMGLPTVAFAYVDPSVMTYTIQALAGVAVALSAVLGVVFRRTRRVLMRLLHIDADAGKIKEASVRRIDGNDAQRQSLMQAADEHARAVKAELAELEAPKKLTRKGRFVRALLVCGFLTFTLFVVAPLEVVGQTKAGLLFGFFDVLPIVLIAAVLFTLIAAFAASFLKGTAFDVLLATLVGIGVCCYIQSLFMNGDLPVADGTSILLSEHLPITLISALVWVGVIVFVNVLAWRQVRVSRVAGSIVCVALLVVQVAGLVGVATSRNVVENFHRDGAVATREGLYTLSEHENVVEFVLDTYDVRYLKGVLETDPEALSEFTGFTCYMDSAPKMVPTRYAVPYLLTGKAPTPADDFPGFTRGWFDENKLLKEAQANGFTTGVYSDSMGSDIVNVAPYTENIHLGAVPIDACKMLFELDKMALYRDMPWVLKPLFWFTTDDLNAALAQNGDASSLPYTIDDARFARDLREQKLALNDEDKSFRFIHMMGPHKPYTINAEGYLTGAPTSLEEQARGSLAIVEDYLRQMKELGIYDSSFIIITADHGNWQNAPSGVDEPTSALLLVKPPQTPAEAKLPIVFSTVPTGHEDVPNTVMAALGATPDEIGPTVFDIKPGERERRYWHTSTDFHDDTDWTEFKIDGDVLDWESWSKTGNVIPIPHR